MNEEEKKAIKTAKCIRAGIPVGTCNDDYIYLLNLIETQKAIINLMAEKLTTPINDKKWVIEYYTRLVEETKYGKTNNNKL